MAENYIRVVFPFIASLEASRKPLKLFKAHRHQHPQCHFGSHYSMPIALHKRLGSQGFARLENLWQQLLLGSQGPRDNQIFKTHSLRRKFHEKPKSCNLSWWGFLSKKGVKNSQFVQFVRKKRSKMGGFQSIQVLQCGLIFHRSQLSAELCPVETRKLTCGLPEMAGDGWSISLRMTSRYNAPKMGF